MFITYDRVFIHSIFRSKNILCLKEDSCCLEFLVLGRLEDIVDGLVKEVKIEELNCKN